MRLLIVVDRYTPEARSAAHLYEDLAKGLARRGHAVAVVTKKPTENLPDGSEIPGVEVKDGIRVIRMRRYLGEPRSTLLKGLEQLLFALRVWVRLRFLERPDAVLVYSPPLFLAAACAAAKHPLVVNLHDIYPRTAVELGRLNSPLLIAAAERLEEFVYRRARRFVVPAPDSVRYLTMENGIPPDRVRLCYNWVDPKTTVPGDGRVFRHAHGLEGKFVVTYAGLVGIAQDLSAVVEAAKMAKTEDDIVFLIIGEGSELDHWKAEAAALKNVRFLATLPREGYLEALRASDVCLLALSADLRSPAIPGKLPNIMAVAKPVVAIVPAGSAAARTVEAAGCGVVTDPGDGSALLKALTEMRSDVRQQIRWGEAGREFARCHFTLEVAVNAFEQALRESASENLL
ncbi:MAG: glycosyltransferase family 4 protein [Elusimicrobia bacterium]|nr:glycosyltransferase family 4 protein [Elusimicrobiota bacterium]